MLTRARNTALPRAAARLASGTAFAGEAATTTYLRNNDNGAEVYLVGTAHVSRASAEEVRRVIRAVRPDTVLVELCAPRAAKLMAPPDARRPSSLAEALSLLGGAGSLGEKVLGLGLKGFYAAWRHAGLEPGLEFKVALEEAAALRCRVVHGDRAATATLSRLASAVDLPAALRALATAPPPPPHLARVVGAGASMEDAIERLKDRRVVREMATWLRHLHPGAVRVLLDERDEILAHALRQCTGRVVGVVGLAHCDGIERRWAEANGEEPHAALQEGQRSSARAGAQCGG